LPDRTWEVVLLRHGQTEWSRDGRHTGRSDIPLTDAGREEARLAGNALRGRHFGRVLVSPLQRARDTAALAGLDGSGVRLDDALLEWDYGEYEGLTWVEIQQRRPGWSLWRDGCPGGEMPDDVGRRVDPLVAELGDAGEDVAVVAHGHLLRVLASRFVERPTEHGAHLALSTAAICVLGFEHDLPTLSRWNDVSHLRNAV
jgi:probable phosphoglycerate mutase